MVRSRGSVSAAPRSANRPRSVSLIRKTHPLTVLCSWCTWSATGRVDECARAHREHRESEHPAELARASVEVEAARRAKKDQRQGTRKPQPISSPSADEIIGILRTRGELSTHEIAEVIGRPTATAGVIAGWAVRRGDLDVREIGGTKYWRIAGTEPLRVIEGANATVEMRAAAVLAILRERGPCLATDLAEKLGRSTLGVKATLGHLKRQGKVEFVPGEHINHCALYRAV